MSAPIFKCFNKNGKIQIPDRFFEYCRSLPEVVQVVVKPWKNTRSNNQNNYLWGVVYAMISEQTGMSMDDLHEFFKVSFNSRIAEIRTKTGIKGVKVPKTTTTLSTVEFEAYIAEIKKWAFTFLDIIIPEPNEVEL